MQRIIFGPLKLFLQLLFLLQIGCTKELSHDPKTLVIALGSQPNSLDPRFATDANGMRVAQLIFNSLVRIGPDLNVIGDAADSWVFADNIYTFRLKPGLKFSNGRPLRTEDILFSFAEFQKPNNPFHSALNLVTKVEAIIENERFLVKVHLKEYSAKILTSDLPAVKLLPKAELSELGDRFGETLIGTGSFKFERQTGNEIVLSARKDHSFAAPQVDQLVFKIIRDDLTRFQKTLKGSIDIAQAEIPLNKIKAFQQKPENFDVYNYPGLSMSYLLVNLNDASLQKKALRQALAHGLQREDIIRYKLENFASVATSILTPNNPFFNHEIKNLPFNLEKGKALIGSLQLSGQELSLKTSNSQGAIENGKVIANQLAQLGIKVDLQSFEWGTFYEDVSKGNFQLATMRWIGALDPDIYRIALHSNEKPPGRNRGNYVNPRLDHLLELGLKESNLDRRKTHYKKVQKIVADDLPIIPLWYDEQVAVVNKRVKNYQPSLNGDFSPFISVTKE